MRRILMVAVMVGSVGGHAAADNGRNRLPAQPPKQSCAHVANQLVAAVNAADSRVRTVIVQRCEKDRWSAETKTCFANVTTSTQASLCLDTLSKNQRKAVEGDADRLSDPRLSRWLFRRTLIADPKFVAAPVSPTPFITLASLDTTADPGKARMLHMQGLAAYKAGRYDLAVRKLEAALDVAPSPELLYHAAQAYRLNGDRAKALDAYERYIELAPEGPAAGACRAQIERLYDVP